MTAEEKLILDLRNWKNLNGKPFTIYDWIVNEGSMPFAIGYSFLFWPDFVEYDGCIIIKNHFNKHNFETWKQVEYITNYAQIESVLNHIHLLDWFGIDEKRDEINHEQIRFLGNRICEIYRAKLNIQFPDRNFIFEFNGNDILEAFDEYELTFYQPLNSNRVIKH